MGNNKTIFRKAGEVIPGGVNSGARKLEPALTWSKGEGAYLWDMNKRKYIDFHGAWGPVILGYNYQYLMEKVIEAVRKYDLYGIGVTDIEVELAQRILGHYPSADMVLTCTSGSEATMHSIRVSRAMTKRRKIIKFQGCFNGGNDYVLRNALSKPDMIYRRDVMSEGILDEVIDSTLVCRLNDLDNVEETIKDNPEDIAAIILEPLAHNIGCVFLEDEFLMGLRKLCDDHGIILIFDEIVTGFRVDIGGWQAVCGVKPDLTTLGKAMANGYPIAALLGKKDIMERFTTNVNGDVFFQGTYNGHPMMTAAALATMDILENENVYEHIFKLGSTMRKELQFIIDSIELEATVVGYGSVFLIYWGKGPFNKYEDLLRLDTEKDLYFRRGMIKKGFYFVPVSLKRCLFNYSHTEEDMHKALEAAKDLLNEIKTKFN
ncbi:aspartate aminotransferase family protein [Actinomycetota bacterium]